MAGTGSWRRRRAKAVGGVVAAGMLGGLFGLGGASPASAAPGDIGVEGPAYVQDSEPTALKAESKVWFHDGFWWADMLRPEAGNPARSDHYIHKLVNGVWQATSAKIDSQASTNSDVLVDGNKLYVATHHQANVPVDNSLAEPDTVSELYRYTYDTVANTYMVDAGFNGSAANRVVITPYQVEMLTIAKANNRLWATWVQGGKVYVNSTTAGNDAAWGIPAPIGTAHSTVSEEIANPPVGTPRGDSDISAIVSFGGQVGIFWSNQLAASDGFYFARESGGTWTEEAVLTDADPLVSLADDHVDLAVSDAGQVFATVKTRNGNGETPQVHALRRNGANNWSAPSTVWVGNNNRTRPIIVINESKDLVQVFATGPQTPGAGGADGNGEFGGAIYRRTAPMDTLVFGPTSTVIKDGDQRGVQNPTSTKQTVNDLTGLVVLAANDTTKRYWHHFERPCGPFPDGRSFADRQYRDFIGRPATAEEQTLIAAQCQGTAPANIVISLMRNPVFSGPYAPVTRLYSAYFLRLPDKTGLDYYVGLYRDGYPLSGISSVFAGSPEFRSRYGNLTDAQFVTRIYNNVLSRNPSTRERDYWVNVLRSNTRGAVMKGFSESAEYKSKMRNEVEIILIYRGMLQRIPTTAEYDLWRLRLDGRTHTLADLVNTILASEPYHTRAGL